ncbi:GNAT family N-acetyltransferase [Candidatus Bipolaricaulota bacterium]|nr:GNAT family N-acetyltransferase [Candidatus Bipolaricaulota bacterium]
MIEQNIRIEKGSAGNDGHISDIAGLLYDAFEPKMAALGLRREVWGKAALNSLVIEHSFFAYRGNKLVGVVGVATRSGKFLHFQLRELLKHVNPVKALFYYLALNLERRILKDELRIAYLAVAKEVRGQGVGKDLLHRVEQFAAQQGFALLSLDVVDTNLSARGLYEKSGFTVVKTIKFGFLTRRAGFTGAHHMQKRIAGSSSQETGTIDRDAAPRSCPQ